MLFALGTNMGIRQMAITGEHGVGEAELRHVRATFVTRENLRRAITTVVNATLEARDPAWWGEATRTASDSKRFASWDSNLMTEFHARYGGYGVMIYWHGLARCPAARSRERRTAGACPPGPADPSPPGTADPSSQSSPRNLPTSQGIIEHMGHYEPKHAKPASPFPETVTFKMIAVGAVITVSAGVAATGGAVATYAYRHTGPGPAYALALTGHADGYHSDPGGEFIRIEPSPVIGTVPTIHLIPGPGD